MNNENDVEKNRNDPFALNPKNIKMDLMLFKNDILKDIKSMQKNFSDKFNISNNVLKEKLESYDSKLKLYNEKIVQLSNKIIEDKNLKENVNKLLITKTTFDDKILTQEIKIKNIEKDYNDKICQINNILSDSVVYPNVIGGISKFKTFHDFIDYVLAQIIQNNTYKEKNTLDLNSYKNKLENLIKSFQLQLDNIIKSANEFTTKSVNECEERIKNILKLYDERFQNVRVENSSYAINLEQYYNELKEEFKKFVNIKNNIYNKFNNEIYNMKKDNIQVVKIFGNYKKEFNLIKDRFTKLSEFIKDVRFRKNFDDLKRRDFLHLGNQMDFSKIQHYDIPSDVKRYIKGEIKAEELTIPKKFSKTNFNFFEEEFSKSNDNTINSYLNKNLSFKNNNNSNNEYNRLNSSTPLKNRIEYNNNMAKRKSVYNLLTPFSLKDYKNNSQKNNILNKYQLINNFDSNSQIIKNEKNIILSNEIKGRKRYTSFSSANNNILSQLKNLENSEKLKLNNNKSPIIKEENETNSNLSEISNSSSSNKNNSNISKIVKEEEKKNNNEKINKNININILNNINSNLEKISKKEINNNNIIVENDIKFTNTKKEKNVFDKKTTANNIIIDCENKNNNEINKNNDEEENKNKIKENIEKKPLNKENKEIIEIINDNKDKSIRLQENSDIKIFNIFKPSNITDDMIDKENKSIKKVLKNDNLKKNEDIKDLIINKIDLNDKSPIIKEIRTVKTINSYSSKKKDEFKKVQNQNKSKKTIEDFQDIDLSKSFKGKKYPNFSNSLVMKIKENLIQDNRNLENKDLNKTKNFFNNNRITFNLDEENQRKGKIYSSVLPSERNKDAKVIQKMVNNLRSYIINYNNNLDEINSARITSFKDMNNINFKDLNNSSSNKTQFIGNNGYTNRNTQKNKDNIVNLKLK